MNQPQTFTTSIVQTAKRLQKAEVYLQQTAATETTKASPVLDDNNGAGPDPGS